MYSYPETDAMHQVLVDFPVTAKFLTPEERAFVIWRKSEFPHATSVGSQLVSVEYDNSSVGEEEHFEMAHLVQAITDWQLWLHILIYMSIVGPCTLFPLHIFWVLIFHSVWNHAVFAVCILHVGGAPVTNEIH